MVSSKEVAKLAGVSQATVSRVINGAHNVKKDTTEKVKRAMEELGYRPNTIARSLVMNRTKTIALLSGSLHNPYYAESTSAIINLATKRGYKTIVYFENDMKKEDAFDLAISHNVDGVIFSSINLDDPIISSANQSVVPYIMFNRRNLTGENYIILENRLGGRLAMEHLLQLGHKRIGVIMGPMNVSTFSDRLEGAFELLKESNVPFDSTLLKHVDTSPKEIEGAVMELLTTGSPPTAILCGTDHMALIAMDTIKSMGYSIPEDISLIGFDDIAIAKHQAIQLTTIAHNIELMSELAVNYLISIIEGKLDQIIAKQMILEPHLVVRKTTKQVNHKY